MIGFLSNVNIEPIKAFFKGDDTYFSGYNQYGSDLVDPTSPLYSDELDTVLLFLDGDELLRSLLYEVPTRESGSRAEASFEELLQILEGYVQNKGPVTLVMNNLALTPYNFLTYLDSNTLFSFSELENELNRRLKGFSGKFNNVLLLDWQRVVRQHGFDNLYDERFWYLGRVRLNNRGFAFLKKEFDRLINAYRGQTKKVLVLDLDNTLWGGVLGEDGMDGIELSEDGIGKAFRDLQFAVKSLQQLGVILAVNSKNDEVLVQETLAKHPMTVLKADDFVVMKVNWNDKAQNMVEIGKELNLGLDSFVFIDDSPVERQAIRDHLPEVVVPDLPKDAASLPRWFYEEVVYPYFARVNLTPEDRVKTTQYKTLVTRSQLSRRLDPASFIKSLQIKLTLHRNPRQFLQRLAQLTQKTNQFNMTTVRCTPNDVERLFDHEASDVFALEYEDRYGKEGIVGMAVVTSNGTVASVDNLLMSCRVIGRSVEYSFLRWILHTLRDSDVRPVEAAFIPTDRNGVAEGFYEDAGFQRSGETSYCGDLGELLEQLDRRSLIQDVVLLES